ncbi:TetR/AcrR family transcriptional regulator [Streptomyces sp. NPDC091292]|uniref:TetR/AcrR family transcriptional regulator n=1 Tax=Streptomyces sp. NPDC091292 TaxID=3365991 RepID=UPI00381188B5
MSENEVRRRTGGRSARVRTAVLDVTLQVIAERGADAVAIGDVARRAGVHETSVYRRWGSPEQLILDALLNHSHQELRLPDTGAIRGDLVVFARSVAAYLATPLGAALARSMAATDDDPALAEGRAQFWRTRAEAAQVLIDRATTRGELPPHTDATSTLELLVAPLHFRALLTRQPIDDHLIDHTVDVLLRGLSRG